jgi:hypothetical protein|tara:strand:- start:1109 stop:1330 length:222 start_codon:yes stop_codon:yes gene_type:complete
MVIFIQNKMKKSELRELVTKWQDLKRRSKNNDLSQKIRLIEHQYYHETGRNLEDELDGKGLYDLYRHATKLIK